MAITEFCLITSIEVRMRDVEAKRTRVKELTVAMQTAFRVKGEYAAFFGEYAPAKASFNGALQTPVPPICLIEMPRVE